MARSRLRRACGARQRLNSSPAAGAALPSTDYANPFGSGNRTGTIATSGTIPLGNATYAHLINGLQDSAAYFSSSAAAGKYIEFDFGTAVYIDEVTWAQQNSTPHGTWKWQGWDGAAWNDVSDPFTLGGGNSTVHDLSGNTALHEKYRLLGISGSTSGSPYLYEVTFKVSA